MSNKTSVELKKIRNALCLSRGETCKANNLLAFRKCIDCPFNITDSNGKQMCFEDKWELQVLTQLETITVSLENKNDWEITIKSVELLQ